MPRNRRPQKREEKRAEIVAAAAELFTRTGYDETPMTAIAAAAGVATNTIYWYFADKDALLVAVLDRVLAAELSDAAQHVGDPWEDQLLWAVERLERYSRLVTVVHARTAIAPAVDAWHTDFHRLAEEMLAHGFRRLGVPEESLRASTQVGVFVVEGFLLHPETAPSRREVIDLLARLGSTAPRPLPGSEETRSGS
ncbi:TetR/AcrR family transcriptional regulator [Nocardioides sp. R1-1]|uniref:TetR/AcrR family transcriptional regulator n=1 Tax=Nocardioides sp. R1-1 TaxID=3383502 RepID=UPI0038D0A090